MSVPSRGVGVGLSRGVGVGLSRGVGVGTFPWCRYIPVVSMPAVSLMQLSAVRQLPVGRRVGCGPG